MKHLWGLSRQLVAVFSIATAVYAFLASSSFTYQQFLRPRVLESVASFGDWHWLIYWFWLALAVASLAPDLLPFARRARNALAIGFAAVWSAVGVALTVHPVLPALADDWRSVVAGLVALLPLLWLAVIDHLAARDYLRLQPERVGEDGLASTERRLFIGAVGAAVFVPLAYGVLTPLAVRGAFEPDLLTTGLTLGLAWSALDHLLIFGALFLLMAAADRVAGLIPGFGRRYGIALALVTAVVWLALQRILGDAIGLDGALGGTAMLGLSGGVVSTWAALRLRKWERESARLASGFDVFFGPSRDARVSASTVGSLVGIVAAAWLLATVAARMDWDFLLLKLGVLTVWIVAFTQIYRASSGRGRPGGRELALICALPLVGHYLDPALQSRLPQWLGTPGSTVRHTLDRYIVYNPTFRLADDALHGPAAETPAFDRFVRANTGLSSAAVSPVDIDFVPALQSSTVDPKPFIFLLVVDSLRPDYLGPYNERVRFTPRIAEFASESIVFRNAFTRYGGTGLSMSTVWMGAAGPHRQYVQPFRPMNALEKLLEANGYQRFVSMDHIMEQLLTASPDLVALDRGIPELEYDFCRTLGEIGERLRAHDAPSAVFAHTRSLNLHVAALNSGMPATAQSYPGFEQRYAARVHRMDDCFGRFIDDLKRRGVYDRSVVILTSDHGEMLGEDRQWGHAYYLFPQVLEIPLIVHLPAALARNAAVDVDAVSFSTDITPTLYAVLGYQPRRMTPLMGQSLIGAPGTDFMSRRRSTEVVAASYGAVWGVLRENGRHLYIVDANHGKEYAYQRPPRGAWRPVKVTEGFRSLNRQAIREHIDEVALAYHVNAP